MLCKNTSWVAILVVFIVMIEFLANEIEVKNWNIPPPRKTKLYDAVETTYLSISTWNLISLTCQISKRSIETSYSIERWKKNYWIFIWEAEEFHMRFLSCAPFFHHSHPQSCQLKMFLSSRHFPGNSHSYIPLESSKYLPSIRVQAITITELDFIILVIVVQIRNTTQKLICSYVIFFKLDRYLGIYGTVFLKQYLEKLPGKNKVIRNFQCTESMLHNYTKIDNLFKIDRIQFCNFCNAFF